MARSTALNEGFTTNTVHLTIAAARLLLLSKMNRLSPSFYIGRINRIVGPVRTLLGIAKRHFPGELRALSNLIKEGRPADFLIDLLNLIQKSDLLPIDYMDDVNDFDHPYFDCIPFVPLGLDWDEYDPEHRMLLPCVLLNCFFQNSCGEQSFFIETLTESGYADLAILDGVGENIPVKSLTKSLKLKGIWKSFPAFARYATSSTGSNLLDMGYSQYAECSDQPNWGDFDDWVEEWKRFKPVHVQAFEFMHWVSNDEASRMKELAEFLKEAANVYVRRRSKRSKTTKNPNP